MRVARPAPLIDGGKIRARVGRGGGWELKGLLAGWRREGGRLALSRCLPLQSTAPHPHPCLLTPSAPFAAALKNLNASWMNKSLLPVLQPLATRIQLAVPSPLIDDKGQRASESRQTGKSETGSERLRPKIVSSAQDLSEGIEVRVGSGAGIGKVSRPVQLAESGVAWSGKGLVTGARAAGEGEGSWGLEGFDQECRVERG